LSFHKKLECLPLPFTSTLVDYFKPTNRAESCNWLYSGRLQSCLPIWD